MSVVRGPLSVGEKDRHAARAEHAQESSLRHGRRTADHDQIDQIVRVRQRRAGPVFDGHRAVQSQLGDVLASRSDQSRIAIQPMNRERSPARNAAVSRPSPQPRWTTIPP